MIEPLGTAELNAGVDGATPALTRVRGLAGLYLTRLQQLVRLDLDERQAELLWRDVNFHRRSISSRLERDVGQRVALLDYLVNFQPHLVDRGTAADAAESAQGATRAITDQLTGMYNRFFFDLEMAREMERCRRYRLPASLVMLDLDDFAELNERRGREVGDEVLQGVSALILHQVRAPDVSCRYADDGFAILLPGTPQVEALSVAQRICGDVGEWFQRNALGTEIVPVSVSAGVASLAPESETASSDLIQEASAALADAKRLGGHRVIAPLSGMSSSRC